MIDALRHRLYALLFAAVLSVCLALLTPAAALADQTPSPPGAKSYIISPQDGDVVSSPVTVQFGLVGMGIAPAGVEKENTGHHHLLINNAVENVALKEPLPAEENLVHFGGGQTETTIELPPGTYRLQLLLADHNHIPHAPPVMSEVITITVE